MNLGKYSARYGFLFLAQRTLVWLMLYCCILDLFCSSTNQGYVANLTCGLDMREMGVIRF